MCVFVVEFVRLGPFFRKTVADANAPVQEKALDALIVFLKVADADVGRWSDYSGFCEFFRDVFVRLGET